MKTVHYAAKIRKFGIGETIPYELLLLADETEEAIDQYIHAGDIFVIEQNRKIVAIYVLHALSNTEIEIKNIAVSTNLQNLGIGSLLLADAATRAAIAGYHEIIVGTPSNSSRLINFYEKAGFVIYDRKVNFYLDHYPDPIIENGVQLTDMVMLKKKLNPGDTL